MFKKILVPYDTSKPSEKALKWAVELTRFTDSKGPCEIIILHVVPTVPATPLFVDRPVRSPEGRSMLLSEYVKLLYAEMQTRAREMLEGKKKDVETTNAKATVKTMVQIGDSIADEICGIAKEEKVDLIVIGNVGLSGLSKLKTLGSVSRGVSERAPCPVIIVH